MLSMRLYQAFVLLFPLMISWNSVASSKRLWKRQAANLCPNARWLEYEGMCFLKISSSITHREAYDLCRNKLVGSTLAKIRSMDDLNTINSKFGFDTNNYWIGLRKEKGRNWIGESTWQDGSPATFLNFAPGQPTNNTNQDCILLRKDLGFYDVLCSERQWPICSIPASVDLCNTVNVKCHENAQCYSTFSTFLCLCNEGFAGDGISSCISSSGCPSAEWKEHKGMCYIRNLNKIRFEDARNECRSNFSGSTLATIRYKGDEEFILNSFEFSGSGWIGLRKKYSWREELRWDDKSIVSYRNYFVREPNDNGGRENCIIFDKDGGWIDIACNVNETSFCSISVIDAGLRRGSASTGGIGGVVVVVLVVLGIGAFVGYRKFTAQRSNAQSDPPKQNDVNYQRFHSNA